MSDRPLRVLQIITRLDVGGAQETAVAGAAALDGRGFAMVLAAGPDDDTGSAMWRRAADRGLDTTVVPSLVGPIDPRRDRRALAELADLIGRVRPDVVHSHSSKAGVLARVAARRAGVPAVHTVHGWSFRDEQPWIERTTYLRLERALAGVTARFVVVTARDRAIGLDAGIGRRCQYAVVRSGIELARFAAAADATRAARLAARLRLGVPADAPVVGAVMRLAPPKDPVTLVRAVAGLARADRPAPWLVVIGDGPMRPAVDAEAERVGLADRLVVTGVRDDVAELLAGVDVFALSSLSEGMPRSVVEAMAAGRPVVSTDVGGLREIISGDDRHRSGFLVPVGDAGAMSGALGRLLGDAELARRVGQAGRRAVEPFDVSAMAEGLAAVYRQAATGAGPGAVG